MCNTVNMLVVNVPRPLAVSITDAEAMNVASFSSCGNIFYNQAHGLVIKTIRSD